jgi:hypothetical protein
MVTAETSQVSRSYEIGPKEFFDFGSQATTCIGWDRFPGSLFAQFYGPSK